MSKANPLGLLVNYGESDDDSDDGVPKSMKRISDSESRVPVSGSRLEAPSHHPMTEHLSYSRLDATSHQQPDGPAGVHPAPIPHCLWSACYDENSGFTYYWNQHTNAVTWEAPPEYLLALKVAQQQLHTAGSTEVSAEEWQLYQQALAEKQSLQNKALAKAAILKNCKKPEKPSNTKERNAKTPKKRPISEDEEEKIELITSYHNSDSDSNDETEKPPTPKPVTPKPPANKPKVPPKKPKTKLQPQEYGPSLPPNQNYSMPIGPELPPKLTADKPKSPQPKEEHEEAKSTQKSSDEDSDDSSLLKILKDKAKLLEKLGGELPSELQKIINDETKSLDASPKTDKYSNSLDIDNLLEEIEKKELPRIKSGGKEIKDSKDSKSNTDSGTNTPTGDRTPPLEELKALYPDSELIINVPTSLFPSAVNIDENTLVKPVINVEENIVDSNPSTPPPEKEKEKKENVYLLNSSEVIGNATRKKLRISNSVLPERKKSEKVETPAYTTKYSQFIEGFSSERVGLGFSKYENVTEAPNTTNNTISYGNGLQFTKGETLNEEKKDEDLGDLTELLEAKLAYLSQVQAGQIAPVQEMFVQMQTLSAAYVAGALRASYWRQWSARAMDALARHEAAAAPPGWRASFTRSEGRYCYRREADGLLQWEYPASTSMDMDICTTPPLPDNDVKEEIAPQPPPPALAASLPAPPLPKAWSRATPPPPGTEVPTPSPPPIEMTEIGDELASFYSDLAEMDKPAPAPAPATGPAPPSPPAIMEVDITNAKRKTKASSCEAPPPPSIREKDIKNAKKKSKMKISTSLSMKNKSVSSLVAKWQQVADQINSD